MKRPALFWTAALLLLLLVAVWGAMALRSVEGQIQFEAQWLRQVFSEEATLSKEVLLQGRAPRCLASLVVGMGLALAGLVLQGVTRNPLADPYLLGVSGGAGLAVVILHAFPSLVQSAGWWLVPLVAFLGAQGATFLVLFFARGAGGRLTILGLILAGVVINAFCAALMSFILVRFDPFRLRVTTIWLAGGIESASWTRLLLALLVLASLYLYLRAQAHRLNAFALGSSGASYVGVDAQRLLLTVTIIASVLTGISVSLGGLLGYVGLIVPHGVRLLTGHSFRSTLPLTALAGALLLLLADTGAYVLFAPEEIPVGVLTALIGCPVLVALLRTQLRGQK